MKKHLLFCILFFNSLSILQAQVSRIPFHFNGKHIYIKVKTGSSDTLNFVFDTGATSATIDSATAEQAGVSKNDRHVVTLAGSGGEKNYTMAVNQTVSLGGLQLAGLDLILINFSALSAKQGLRLDGIIG